MAARFVSIGSRDFVYRLGFYTDQRVPPTRFPHFLGIDGLVLIEYRQNRYSPTLLRHTLGLAATAKFDVTGCCAQHLKRPTANALANAQKSV